MTKQEYRHNCRQPWTLHDLLLMEELLGKLEGPEKINPRDLAVKIYEEEISKNINGTYWDVNLI